MKALKYLIMLLALTSAQLFANDTPSTADTDHKDELKKYIIIFNSDLYEVSGKGDITVRKNQSSTKRRPLLSTGESAAEATERVIERLKQEQQLRLSRSESKIDPEAIKIKYVYEHALTGASIQLPTKLLSILETDTSILLIQPVGTSSLDTIQYNPPSWGLDRIDQRNLPLSNSYEYDYDGDGVHAYVIDTGLWLSHTQFTGRVGNGYDFIENDSTPQDCNGHGTHVAGTLGSTDYGVAKEVTIHPVRVAECGRDVADDDLIAGIDWVANNHQTPAVANISISGDPDSAIDFAAQSLWNSGVTVIVSAGNNSGLACSRSPARVDDLLTIANSTSSDSKDSQSNYGSCVDLFAPGNSITSAWSGNNNASDSKSGTSMASPHVAGVAARILDQKTSYSPFKVNLAIMASSSTGKISNPGSGTPNRLLYSNIDFPIDIERNGSSYGTFMAPSCNWVLQSQTSVTIHHLECMGVKIVQRVRHSGGCSLSLIATGFSINGYCTSSPYYDDYEITMQ